MLVLVSQELLLLSALGFGDCAFLLEALLHRVDFILKFDFLEVLEQA